MFFGRLLHTLGDVFKVLRAECVDSRNRGTPVATVNAARWSAAHVPLQVRGNLLKDRILQQGFAGAMGTINFKGRESSGFYKASGVVCLHSQRKCAASRRRDFLSPT